MARSWMTKAPCLDPDVQVEWLERPVAAQKAVCRTCPVWFECLEYAIETKATRVVMGGVEIREKPIRKLAEEVPENASTA